MVDAAIKPMTIADFIELYEEQPFELIEGERIPLVPPVMIHVLLVKRLLLILSQYEQQTGQGEAFAEAPFVLPHEYDANWVKGSRVPDLMFINATRLKMYREETPDWGSMPMLVVPDLAVEVVSPNDRYSAINAKVDRYLLDGVQVVWVVDAERQSVVIHTQGSDQQRRLSIEDTLNEESILPGLVIRVSELFKE